MSGTLGALHLIERTTAHLCDALTHRLDELNRALSSAQGTNPAAYEAAKGLGNYLNLRQVAWGPSDQPVTLPQLNTLAQGLPDHLTVDPSALPSATVFRAATGRIVLNILLLASDSLPKGGRIILAGAADDLFVRISGPGAAWPAGMTLCMANVEEAQAALTDGRNLQMAVTTLLAHAAGIRLSALLAPAGQSDPVILRLGS